MITLTNGHVQGPNNIPVPNGTVELILSQDATVIAAPYGQVMASIPIIFKFDSVGDLLAGAQIWSNAELSPSGTAYLVNFYDANGARVNVNPFIWVFTQSSGSSVDIGTIQTTSNSVSYPSPIGSGIILAAQVVITATQLANLIASPVQLIAAPGAGKFIFPISCYVRYTSGGTPFTAPSGHLIVKANADTNLDAGFFMNWSSTGQTGVVDNTSYGVFNGAFTVPTSLLTNQPWIVGNDNNSGINPTGGNGTITVTVLYYIGS